MKIMAPFRSNFGSWLRMLTLSLPVLSVTVSGAPACGDTIASYATKDDLATFLREITNISTEIAQFSEGFILPALQNGVQVVKVCGSCADYPNQDLCPPDVYGFAVPHSGLLILPLATDNIGVVTSGTNMMNVHFHGILRHPEAAPSSAAWPPNLFFGAGFDIFVGLAASGLSGTYTLLPDYQGFGESSPALFPSTLVQQGYVTATWPVIQAAKSAVAALTDCQAAIGNQLFLSGYSEGGYAAVAVMDKFSLYAPELELVQTVAGAGAFRTTRQLLEGFKGLEAGVIDASLRFVAILTAIPFSSTTTDVINFGTGQDLIDPDVRQLVLDTFAMADDDFDLNTLTNETDPFGLYNPSYFDLLKAATEIGIQDLCQEELPADLLSLVDTDFDLLCLAILDQDLTVALENANVPVTLFHSSDDEFISIANLPDVAANPDFLSFVPLQGPHVVAGGTFLLGLVQQFFLDPATRLANFVTVDNLTLPDGCAVVDNEFPDTVFRATVICEGGEIYSESSNSFISVCYTGACDVSRARRVKSSFGLGLLTSLHCDADSAGGLCVYDATDELIFTDKCSVGEASFITLTRDNETGDGRKLGGPNSSSMDESGQQMIVIDGKKVIVHDLFHEAH